MPLQHVIYLDPHTIIGVWHLVEPESYFIRNQKKLVTNLKNLQSITHANRRIEWLAGRWLVLQLVEIMNLSFSGIWTDEHNKPHLTRDNASISISHASPYVVAILNTKKLCGIDVEKLRDKLIPLAPKFLNDSELTIANNNLTNLAVLWGAKEALYKLHGRKSLIFKDNLEIENFSFNKGLGSFKGVIKLDNENERYAMKAAQFDDFVLVFSE